MGALTARIAQRITDRVDFNNDGLEQAVESLAQKSFELAAAANRFEAAAENLDLDPEAASAAVLGLAEQFGEAFPAPAPDRTERIKALVHELVDEEDAVLEAATEALFDAALDFEVGVNALNGAVNDIVPQ